MEKITNNTIISARSSNSKNNKTSILLVEDNMNDADLMTYYLKQPSNQFDQSTLHVKSLKEGLDALSQEKFDIILLDLSLPDSIGFDTFLKIHKRYPKTPIIACTGFDDYDLGVRTVKYGAQDFISKEELNSTMIKRSIQYAIERKNVQLELETLNIKLDQKVQERTEQLLKEKQIVEKKNKQITNNLNYARHIQAALMSQEESLSDLISESFVFNSPYGIVGGDFYWYSQVGEELIVAVADCTGHGVSGALLSINGWSQLNQLVIEKNETNPAIILGDLNKRIKNSLQHDRGKFQPNDGMDIGICSINLKKRRLRFSGANRPLYLFEDNNFSLIPGTRSPIGGVTTDENTVYNLYELEITQNNMVYLFSDGFPDQFGGSNDKKLNRTNFIDLLQSINTKPVHEQKNNLVNFFNSWKGNKEQTDDVLVLGLKIS